MSLVSKILTTGAVSAGAIVGWSYFKNLKKASTELEVIPKASLQSLSWDGLTIRLDVLMKNPTKGSFSIKFPFVKLLYKETVIGSSQAIDKNIKIPAYSEAMIDKMLIQIPMISVFSVVFTIIKALFNNDAIKLTVRTMTTIDIGLFQLPYDDRQEVSIKK
jgi:hypothetical protein